MGIVISTTRWVEKQAEAVLELANSSGDSICEVIERVYPAKNSDFKLLMMRAVSDLYVSKSKEIV